MSPEATERAFEAAVEEALLAGGPQGTEDTPIVHESSPSYGVDFTPGGYHRRTSDDYDRAHCLIPRDVIDFIKLEMFPIDKSVP